MNARGNWQIQTLFAQLTPPVVWWAKDIKLIKCFLCISVYYQLAPCNLIWLFLKNTVPHTDSIPNDCRLFTKQGQVREPGCVDEAPSRSMFPRPWQRCLWCILMATVIQMDTYKSRIESKPNYYGGIIKIDRNGLRDIKSIWQKPCALELSFSHVTN